MYAWRIYENINMEKRKLALHKEQWTNSANVKVEENVHKAKCVCALCMDFDRLAMA